ncbi:hypothetical protein ACVMIH_007769 [Bradyrhizobium sp. USDA 4503]
MPFGDNQAPRPERSYLNLFEPPPQLVEPAVRACRLFNTTLDLIFYNVPALAIQLAERDAPMRAREEKPPSRIVQFDALSDPEGSLLLIDANTAPYVHRYTDVELFLASPHAETRAVEIATITGVGSSALGSAAMAWDISRALGKPVLAIVPGYGMADVMLQALGGWFGFGLYDYVHAKSLTLSPMPRPGPRASAVNCRRPHRTRRRFMAHPFFATGLAPRTYCTRSSFIARLRSGCWLDTARAPCRLEMRSVPFRRSERETSTS